MLSSAVAHTVVAAKIVEATKSLVAVSCMTTACERSVSGAENGAERPENRVERSGAVSGRGRKTVERRGAERGAGGRGAGTERGAG